MLRAARLLPIAAAFTIVLTGCPGSARNGGNAGATGNANSTSTQSGRASDARRKYHLDALPSATITINGKPIRVWLAVQPDQQQEGLMFVPSSEIADDQGMLFVFPDEQQRGFWMMNTIAPLDIAFARMNGDIVKIWQMPPLTLDTFPSVEPAMFALEMKQGSFAQLGVKEGDKMVFPPSVFNLQR